MERWPTPGPISTSMPASASRSLIISWCSQASSLPGWPPRSRPRHAWRQSALCLLSFLFWQLDRRTSFLIKHAEDAIKLQEPVGARLMTEEVVKTANAKKGEGLWTYGKVFRSIFLVMAIVGLAGAIVSGLRGSGKLSWEDPNPPRQLARPDFNGEPALVQSRPSEADVALPEVRTPERRANAER